MRLGRSIQRAFDLQQPRLQPFDRTSIGDRKPANHAVATGGNDKLGS
jgi:hypothetical protein